MRKNSIKICFVFDSVNYGGAVKLSLELIEFLLNDDFEISIVSLNNTPESIEKFKGYIPDNVKVFIININTIKFKERIKRLKSIFREYDIIHSCLENANFYTGLVSLLLRKKIYVSSVHGHDGVFIDDRKLQELFKKKEYRKYVFYVKYIQSLLFRNYNLIFASSYDSKIFLERKRRINPLKINMIYYGYNYSKLNISTDDEEVSKLRSMYSLKTTDFLIGYIGRITYGKGLEQSLLEIIKIINNNRNVKFILVGTGELTSELKKIVNENNMSENIIMTDYVDDISYYFSVLDLFLLPSMSEGIPMVVEEAMYFEVPVITSNAGGLPEIVINGETGVTFEKGDFEGMKNAVMSFIEGKIDKEKIVRSAKKMVLEKFNLEVNYKKISVVLKNLYYNK